MSLETLRDQAIGLFIFFLILTTITVSLRLFVRLRMNTGSFGYDDAALIVTYIGLLLWVGLASAALQYPVGSESYYTYDSAKADVCYIISGTVKISVALVLLRLDSRPIIRAILITDIVACSIWTIVVTIILAVGCTDTHKAIPLPESVCQATNYAQEASYVIFDVFHVIIPVVILWDVQLSRPLKWSIVGLFGVGLFAAVAAIMKLFVFVELYHNSDIDREHLLTVQTTIWAVIEHGLSLFAASILALKPVYNYLSKSWNSFSSRLSSESLFSSAKDSRHTIGSSPSQATKRKTLWSMDTRGTAFTTMDRELRTIDVRNDVEVRSEVNFEELKQPCYMVNAYNDSQRGLVDVGKDPQQARETV